MADSIEQKIVAHAVTSMAAINGTGSYLTTLGMTGAAGTTPSVADGRMNWTDGDDVRASELPAISVYTGEVEIENVDDEGVRVLRKLPITFVGALTQGTTETNARKFIADIHRVLNSIGDQWTVSSVDLAVHTEEAGHSILREESSYEVTGVRVSIDVYYWASKFNMES